MRRSKPSLGCSPTSKRKPQAHTFNFSYPAFHLKTEKDSVFNALWVVRRKLPTVHETSLASVALHVRQNHLEIDIKTRSKYFLDIELTERKISASLGFLNNGFKNCYWTLTFKKFWDYLCTRHTLLTALNYISFDLCTLVQHFRKGILVRCSLYSERFPNINRPANCIAKFCDTG